MHVLDMVLMRRSEYIEWEYILSFHQVGPRD